MPGVEWNRAKWGGELKQFQGTPRDRLWGTQWGDPELRGIGYYVRRLLHPYKIPGPLYKVVDQYIKPYVKADSTVLEIGSGGGRWTRYLISARKVVIVELNAESFDVLRAAFPNANLEFHKTAGFRLESVPDTSIDFAFTFGTFVHIEADGISQYLSEIKRTLKSGGVAVVHYSNKHKIIARLNRGFSDMTPERMEAMAPMRVLEHNTRLFSHSSIIVMEK